LLTAIWQNFTDFSEVFAASIFMPIIEAASTPKTSVNFYQTAWCNNPKDSYLQPVTLLGADSDEIRKANFFYYALLRNVLRSPIGACR
jgi:hypothetical protein